MLFVDKVKEQKSVLLQKWIDNFYASYPLGSTGFVRTSTDKFTNPIGVITQSNLSILYDAVLGEDIDKDTFVAALTEVVQLRAIQQMSPSQAVGPIVQLKSLLKDHVFYVLCKDTKDCDEIISLTEQYIVVEARIDSLLVMALDMYAAQREQIYTLRVEEVKRNQSQVLRWAKLREEKERSRLETEG